MNFFNAESLTTVLSLVMGITSLVGGFLLWHRGAVEKRYAAERDFQHIRADLRTVTDHLAENAADTDNHFVEIRLELKEYKALLLAQSQRFEAILARLESNTGGWSKNG